MDSATNFLRTLLLVDNWGLQTEVQGLSALTLGNSKHEPLAKCTDHWLRVLKTKCWLIPFDYPCQASRPL